MDAAVGQVLSNSVRVAESTWVGWSNTDASGLLDGLRDHMQRQNSGLLDRTRNRARDRVFIARIDKHNASWCGQGPSDLAKLGKLALVNLDAVN